MATCYQARETLNPCRRYRGVVVACRLLGHRYRFRAEGETMRWECARDCGASGEKVYATAEEANRYRGAWRAIGQAAGEGRVRSWRRSRCACSAARGDPVVDALLNRHRSPAAGWTEWTRFNTSRPRESNLCANRSRRRKPGPCPAAVSGVLAIALAHLGRWEPSFDLGGVCRLPPRGGARASRDA